MSSRTTALALSPLALVDASPFQKRAVTAANGTAVATTLQKWYNEETGLWNPSAGWWNSANCELTCGLRSVTFAIMPPSMLTRRVHVGLTVIADYAMAESSFSSLAEAVFANEVTKLRTERIKPKEQLTLEPFERDHAMVVGVYQRSQ